MTKLKDKVAEFSAIASDLPENLQVVCFELLLRNYLEGSAVGRKAQENDEQQTKDPTNKDDPPGKTVEEAAQSQADILTSDLHAKVKRFLDKYSLSVENLNNVLYKEDGKFLPLYEDLGTTRMAEGQIRIALLQALVNAIPTGTFEADVEEVRSECQDRKYYDRGNFTTNFRNNASFFDFEEYDRNTKTVRLSEDGRKELAEVIKQLQ